MKTHRIFETIVITGTTDEVKEWLMEKNNLESVEKLAAGTHHIAKNPPKGIKRPRKDGTEKHIKEPDFTPHPDQPRESLPTRPIRDYGESPATAMLKEVAKVEEASHDS